MSYQLGEVFGEEAQIGTSGRFCVYNGKGTSVSVSGLISAKDYGVQVFGYNGVVDLERYLSSPATDNPRYQRTIL